MGLRRYLRFNVVGVAGFVVQIGAVYALSYVASGFSRTWYPLAITAIAVEAAVLHNFFWHERWTWADRPSAGRARLARLGRFHLTNGLVSIVGNVSIVALLAGLNPIAANASAVLICSLLNFATGDRIVFQAGRPEGRPLQLRASLAEGSSPTYP